MSMEIEQVHTSQSEKQSNFEQCVFCTKSGSSSTCPPPCVARRCIWHEYEIPRKLLHVLVGILVLSLYIYGIEPPQIATWVLGLLVILGAVDIIRHYSVRFNAFHRRLFGFLMRKQEATRYNSLIWYLLGSYIVLKLFPVDVSLMGILILSNSDTAASIFGRLYAGKSIYLRKGKSLVGSLAACGVGSLTAATFWGYFESPNSSNATHFRESFMFTGTLSTCPDIAGSLQSWDCQQISGPLALLLLASVSGLLAAGGEFINLFGWDDNLVLPLFSSLGLWCFLRVFGFNSRDISEF